MPYDVRMRMPNGDIAWLRMAGRRPASCIVCGAPSTKLCDWKIKDTERPHPPIVGRAKSRRPRKTCSAPMCESCTSSPAPGKDLCPSHAEEWQQLLHKRSEVMNPPVSAAEGTEAGNLSTEQRDRTGAVLRGAEARPADVASVPPP
jgi:hypothetical protein